MLVGSKSEIERNAVWQPRRVLRRSFGMNRKSEFLAGLAPLMAGCLLFPAAMATGQTIVQSFDGDSGPGPATCESGVTHCDHPEMNVAASGTQIVQVTWQNVRIYDKSGHLLQSTPMAAFIRKAGLNPVSSNPRIPNPPT